MTDFRRKALFFDRDGTLIAHRPYLCDPAGVELLPDVQFVLGRALRDGYSLFLFTNQSGVGRGYFTMREVDACNARLLAKLDLPAPGFTEICVAPESPDAPVYYRKPSPRFILEMIAKYDLDPVNSWMIGDTLSDVQAGMNAGIRAALIRSSEMQQLPACVWQCASVADFYKRVSAESK